MRITRVSMFTGIEHTLEIDVTKEQLDDYYLRGKLLQNAFPNVHYTLREFIKTGITPAEWEEEFGRV